MRHIVTIIKKQIRDTLRNKTVLIQFVMFPALALIMTKAIQIEGMPADFFIKMFSSMYVGMAPVTSMAAIISEEQEKNTLRVLLMANVTPWQYLVGVGSYVFFFCMLGAGVFCLLGGYALRESCLFVLIMAAGILASLLLGAAIGVGSASQMAATSVTVPVMLLFSFLPMLSMFNAEISKVAKYTYTEQVRLLLDSLGREGDFLTGILVIAVNMLLFGSIFCLLYRNPMHFGAYSVQKS